MTIDSIRPPGAISLLGNTVYAIRVDACTPWAAWTLCAWIRTAISPRAAGTDAVYVVHIPVSHEEQLTTFCAIPADPHRRAVNLIQPLTL
jgi:hypothetical protein